MKISRDDVITLNLDFVKGFVSDIRDNDPIQLIASRVGSKVTVDPDDQEAESVKVEFEPNMVTAVSKGASMDDIVSLINTAAQGGIGALGINPIGSMAPISGIAGATVNTLHEIMTTVAQQGNINLSATAKLLPHVDPISIRLKGSMTGWTRTNDFDSDEQANIDFFVELEGIDGPVQKTENEGTSSQIRISQGESAVIQSVIGTAAKGDFRCSWNLLTDGAFTHDTISLIQIATITMYFEYFAAP